MTLRRAVEGLDHRRDVVLRAFERFDAGPLRGGVDAGVAVDAEADGVADDRRRPDAVAEAPAGHRVGLAPAVEQDEAVADLGVVEHGDVLAAVVGHAVVDLVAEDGDVRVLLEAGDELVDLGLRHGAAGGVGGRVDDDAGASAA